MRVFSAVANACGKRAARHLAMPLVMAMAACASPIIDSVPEHVVLAVRNTTCDPGPCQAIRVLGFPQQQPRTPGGAWSLDLGVVSTATACLIIPASAQFTVTEASTGAVAVTDWTAYDSLTLASWSPTEPRFTAGPTTSAFVPGRANAWDVSLPGTTAPVPAAPCAP